MQHPDITHMPISATSMQLLEMLGQAEAAIFIHTKDGNTITIQAVATSGEFEPDTNLAHAYVHAFQGEHQHLLDLVNGRQNDAVRFRALREFAMLGRGDPERFQKVNGMLYEFEESRGLANEANRSEQDYTDIADFIVLALVETAPVGPIAAPGTDTPQ